jgi:hypothetical protein
MHARHCSPITGRFLSVDPVDSAKPAAPQTWNKFAYAANNPMKFVDPDGKELRLGSGPPARSLQALRLMLPPALRSSVDVATSGRGQSVVTVDNSVRTGDQLYRNLQIIANSPGVVELNMVGAVTPLTAMHPAGGTITFHLGAVGLDGITLPSSGTAVGNEPAFSTQPGVTEIYVTDTLTAGDLAATVAAEIGAHAVPALLGHGAAPANAADHTLREMPLTQAARRNAARP